ncbi:lipoprotein [Streptomyces fradiae]|uniref:lipoprotein n=1 Tax=Streptomyces fradiae TaxID=1906 RepID=UPI002943102B|nr:lipoprotein [Streptomyces fradiae]WOI59027.1 lipoprotein [Streptomyces fradiae]
MVTRGAGRGRGWAVNRGADGGAGRDRGWNAGRDRGGSAGRGAVAVAAAVLLAGCGSDGDSARTDGAASGGSGPSAPASPSVPAAVAPAAKGGTVGAAGSACPLPVAFDVAAEWQPKKVEPVEDPDLAELNELLKQGPFTMACEIDAKPAGQIGFLRVWTGGGGTGQGGDVKGGGAAPRAALESFVTADDDAPSSAVYRDVRVGADGAASATEVTYVVTSALLGERKPVRALAVATPRGPVVLELGGMDGEEHTAMLPAWELAKRSLTAAGG